MTGGFGGGGGGAGPGPPPAICCFALEINGEWAEAILAGTKTVELRSWELPPEAVGRRVALVVPSRPGAPGAPSLTTLGPDAPAAVVGWATFGTPSPYLTPAAAAADEAAHRVPPGSSFLGGGDGGDAAALWAWPVTAAARAPRPHRPPPGGARALRSLWRFGRPGVGPGKE